MIDTKITIVTGRDTTQAVSAPELDFFKEYQLHNPYSFPHQRYIMRVPGGFLHTVMGTTHQYNGGAGISMHQIFVPN